MDKKFLDLVDASFNKKRIDYEVLGIACDYLQDINPEKASCLRLFIKEEKRPLLLNSGALYFNFSTIYSKHSLPSQGKHYVEFIEESFSSLIFNILSSYKESQ